MDLEADEITDAGAFRGDKVLFAGLFRFAHQMIVRVVFADLLREIIVVDAKAVEMFVAHGFLLEARFAV